MAVPAKLNHPWLVAVWPGIGNVALNAGIYLMSKMDMKVFAEFEANEFFDVEHVEVKGGIVQAGRRPRNRFFLWEDPSHQRDIVVLLGEAQPGVGKYPFCQKILSFARELGVERVVTFAAMATQMHPQHSSRVFGAATDAAILQELQHLELEPLDDGNIGGLNGVLLGAAAESGLPGACLLGEMPHILSRIPFPKASQAILQVFAAMTGVELDFTELSRQVEVIERQLGEVLSQVEQSYGAQFGGEEEEEYRPEPVEEERLSSADKLRIERLFDEAGRDRSKAFQLKQELDRMGVFKEYEDRFLDLFKK
ncbi:MAG: PAC2 family protein [Deltaproteobacteria bacterium]